MVIKAMNKYRALPIFAWDTLHEEWVETAMDFTDLYYEPTTTPKVSGYQHLHWKHIDGRLFSVSSHNNYPNIYFGQYCS